MEIVGCAGDRFVETDFGRHEQLLADVDDDGDGDAEGYNASPRPCAS